MVWNEQCKQWPNRKAGIIQGDQKVSVHLKIKKSEGVPRQAEVAQGVPGRLRPRIFLTFQHYKGGRSSAIAPAAFTPGEILGTHFQRLSRPQGTWLCRGYHEKNPQ